MNASTQTAAATALVAQLESIVGDARVLTGDEDRRYFSQDIAGPRTHVAACVAQPQSVAEHEGLRAEPARLLDAIKRAVDPDGVVNPGSLGIR